MFFVSKVTWVGIVRPSARYYSKRFHNSAVCGTWETRRLSGNPQSTNLVYNKNSVLLQTADVILFNNCDQKEVRIKVLANGGSQRSSVSKPVQILSPEIINKGKD